MSLYNDLREQFGSSDPAEKLHVLRSEMLTHIATVQLVVAFLEQVDPDSRHHLPGDFNRWVDELNKAGKNLRDILDALTDPRKRTSP
jgi:hypothetical protein